MHRIRQDGVKETLYALVGEQVSPGEHAIVAAIWNAEGDPLPQTPFIMIEAPVAECDNTWTYIPALREFMPPQNT
jgi:hypothetical protein